MRTGKYKQTLRRMQCSETHPNATPEIVWGKRSQHSINLKLPDKIKEWYKTYLGLATDKYGTTFEWRQSTDSTKKGFTQWSPFAETTKYFEPSLKDFMINYRVDNLEALVKELKKEGVTIVDKMETYDYGKFIHIIDIEGNKVELWEPNDVVYDKFDGGRTK